MNEGVLPKKASFFDKKKVTYIILALIPLLLLVFPVIALFKQTVVVFPGNNLGNRIGAFTDSIWNGRSRIREFGYDKKAMVLKYVLKEGAPNPFVFITLNLGSVEKPSDFSRFDSVSLRIKQATNKRITLFIKTFVPGISLPETKNSLTLRHNQYILQLVPGCHDYTIKLKDFSTPDWWLENMKVNEVLISQESFQKVLSFDMQFN
jgi:hypothetical protein